VTNRRHSPKETFKSRYSFGKDNKKRRDSWYRRTTRTWNHWCYRQLTFLVHWITHHKCKTLMGHRAKRRFASGTAAALAAATTTHHWLVSPNLTFPLMPTSNGVTGQKSPLNLQLISDYCGMTLLPRKKWTSLVKDHGVNTLKHFMRIRMPSWRRDDIPLASSQNFRTRAIPNRLTRKGELV